MQAPVPASQPITRGLLATSARRLRRLARASDIHVRRNRAADVTARVSGAIFVAAGLVKFVFHGWELHAFKSFGLPAAEAFVIAAGVLETAGGVLLMARVLVVPTALVLALVMVVAIAVSGIGHGDVIPSLTLAPALLVAMAFLVWRACAPAVAPGAAR